ncbi:MAG: peptidoglycan-binding protein [Deinococcus-Thermus bacterium]|nr:peptidoglycan-binding protein [Deinococcota bacterium]
MRFPAVFLLCLTIAFAAALTTLPGKSRAQGNVWLQIEALPTLTEARNRARDYGARFDNVNGFRLSSGWYAIALGPYAEPLARAELAALRSAGLIPRDSYISEAGSYGRRFWPVGLGTPAPSAPSTPEGGARETAEPAPEAETYVPDETPAEARRGERLLSGRERRDLQIALQWFGHYGGAIDGAFGPGTRRAMSAWQAAQGYDVTGVLTTDQRAELLATYRAPFEALGLAEVRDERAGIEIVMPTAKVEYARTDAPFVHYDSTDESGMRVLLVSQSGDEATLFGLYDVMQTLEIVPPEGARDRQARQFTLRGVSDDLSSHTWARLEGGAVKGFTLVWRDEDPRVMARVVERMRESFTALPAVLPDSARAGDVAAPSVDLLSGLELRRPTRTRTGFYVGDEGAVLTTTDALAGCARLTVGSETEATIAARDEGLGLALLRPDERLAPRAVAAFRSARPRIRAEVAVAGFSYGDALSLPLLTYGTLADLEGLRGEKTLARLDLSAEPGDRGGPVLDSSGAVIGALRAPPEDGARRLPDGVAFAVDVPAIVAFLDRAGLAPAPADGDAPRAPEDLADLAADLAVPVNCWE